MVKSMRSLPSLLILLALGGPGFAQDGNRVRESVDRGLAFLSTLQENDGSWQLGGQKSPAATGLAVMAFLSAGHVPGEGPYQETLDRAIRWVLRHQQRTGMIAAEGSPEMYTHAICTLMLAEVTGMTDVALARQIKPVLEKAVALIVRGQNMEQGPYRGGWRYQPGSTDADLSVTGWQLLALRAARNCGCDVPAQRIDLATEFVLRCHDPRSGGFCYQPGGPVTKACTGTAILALELRGATRPAPGSAKLPAHADILKAKAYLVSQPLQRGEGHFYYTAYYGAQAMYQPRSNYWLVYRRNLHQLLFEEQQRNGGWIDVSGYGPSYGTAMAILALTVEYRLLPIYQRHEEPG
jgi:hypothetical protein